MYASVYIEGLCSLCSFFLIYKCVNKKMNTISLYFLILLHWSQLQLIWTINITTLKVIFKIYGDLLGPNFLCQTSSAKLVLDVLKCLKLSVCHTWFEWFKTNIVYSTIHVLSKGEGHRKSTFKKIGQIGKKKLWRRI
jgi:hypothetical protein